MDVVKESCEGMNRSLNECHVTYHGRSNINSVVSISMIASSNKIKGTGRTITRSGDEIYHVLMSMRL